MKKKETKLFLFIGILCIIFVLFLILTLKSYNYEKKYTINGFKITEIYSKKNKNYTFYVEDDNKLYSFIIDNKYLRKRELINKIETQETENETCILPISSKLEFYPLCNNGDETYTYNLSINKKEIYSYKKVKKEEKNYKNITINYLNNNSFLLYNYKGFYLVNEKHQEEISLFKKDIYTINLIYQKDNYVLIPDYNQNYYFNKFFIINIESGKIKEVETDYNISFDSIFLGDYKNNIYLLDKKEKKEYEINIKKLQIKDVDFQILKDKKMVKTTFNNIVNNNLTFAPLTNYNYEIINEKIYLTINNNKIRLSNQKVDKIIKIDKDTVYYLSYDNLYMYNNLYGEVKLLSNFEWNFNNTNMIYLYK